MSESVFIGHDYDPDRDGVAWNLYQAKQINMLFAKHSKSGKPGNILPATLQHGFNVFCKSLEVRLELLAVK